MHKLLRRYSFSDTLSLVKAWEGVMLRSLAVLVVMLGLCGQSAAQGKEDKEAERLARAEQRAIQDLLDLVRHPLGRFKLQTPPDCASKDLNDAIVFSQGLISRLVQRGRLDPAVMIPLGASALDVGDAARVAGCREDARKMYDYIVQVFVGGGYAALRQRAQIGIDDLRAPR